MKNKTELKFYAGLDTIGGVVLEIKYASQRLLLEMGAVYNPAFDLFDNKVLIRNKHLQDSLWIKNIPSIDHLFTDTNSTIQTAILISHLHLDHMANMGFVPENVDVYLDEAAQVIEKALEDENEGVYNLRKSFKPLKENMAFDQIKVKAFILNDESYKDYSFFIETPDLKIHYTGDVFLYGRYEEGIKKELVYLKDKQVDILVCEGTSLLPAWLQKTNPDNTFKAELYPANVLSEKQMLENAESLILSHPGLIVFNVYNREMAHMSNWLDLAEKTSRTILFEPKTAYIMNRFFQKSFNVLVPDTYEDTPSYLDYVLKHNTVFTKEEVINNPHNYLVQNSYENILELLDYRQIDTLYLHHSGTPLGAYDPQYARLMTILNSCNIKYNYIYANNEGEFFAHATANQLLWYIKEVNAKLLIPCHTPNRQLEIALANCPSFMCEAYKTYYYDERANTLKEANDEYQD